MSLTILQGNCIEKMREIPDGSIPLVVTSPPYDNLRTYGKDGFTWDFEATAKALERVLMPGGVICWNVADQTVNGSETLTSFRQALFFQSLGLRQHDTMIWEKLNFSHPESARYHSVFEYVFVISKRSPRCFNPIKDKPNATAGRIGALGKNTYIERDGSRSSRPKYLTTEFGMRGNVWRGKTRGQEDMCESKPHPAMMPKWLARDLILSWSNPGDAVLDPMAGSGTVPMMAVEHGRSAIAIDIDPDYCALIAEQTNITKGLALA